MIEVTITLPSSVITLLDLSNNPVPSSSITPLSQFAATIPYNDAY